MASFLDDKNHLAMLAIPIILSVLLGFPGNLVADLPLFESDDIEDRSEESRESEEGERSDYIQVHESADSGSVSGVADKSHNAELMRIAIENSNFLAFIDAAAGTPFADVMTEEVFEELVQAYKLQKQGRA